MSKNGAVRATTPGCRWIDVQNPTEQELLKLQRTYGFSRANIQDILSPAQRPKMDVQTEFAFFAFRFPSAARAKRGRASELDVVLTHDTILTFHGTDMAVVRALISDARLFEKKRQSIMGPGPAHVLYELLRALFDQVYTLSDEVARQTDQLESQVFNPDVERGDLILRIAQLRRRLLDYDKIAKPQTIFLQYCLGSAGRFITHEEQHNWRSLIDTSESQLELLETSLDVLNGISQSNDALTTNHFNQTVRLLTIISVIFLPASFVLTILSNNIPGSPLEETPTSFAIVLGALIVVQAIFLWFLRRRRVI
ncbi:MAG: CorA family divalent cation transporter [Candidatus Andersenbacteria bacterium]